MTETQRARERLESYIQDLSAPDPSYPHSPEMLRTLVDNVIEAVRVEQGPF